MSSVLIKQVNKKLHLVANCKLAKCKLAKCKLAKCKLAKCKSAKCKLAKCKLAKCMGGYPVKALIAAETLPHLIRRSNPPSTHYSAFE